MTKGYFIDQKKFINVYVKTIVGDGRPSVASMAQREIEHGRI